MQKIKSISFSTVLSIIKSCLLGVISTLIGIVLLAVTLKFTDLSSSGITAINNVIKAISIFITISVLKRTNGEKLIIKSIFAGVLYALLSFIIFSVLNGYFSFDLSFVYDLLFADIVSVVGAIILNLLGKKTV